MNRSCMLNPTSLVLYLRTYQGLTQQQVAASCGLNCIDVSRLERGQKGLRFGSLMALASFFGVTPDAIFYDDFRDLSLNLVSGRTPGNALRERLHRHQAYCEQIGNAGEAWVTQLEEEKLKGTGYEGMVNPNYTKEGKAHFDLMSFDKATEAPIIVEVKSTDGDEDEDFFLSDKEFQTLTYCARHGICYELHRVSHVNDPAKRKRRIYRTEEVLDLFDAMPHVYVLHRKGAQAA